MKNYVCVISTILAKRSGIVLILIIMNKKSRKTLFESHGHTDDYTDESFLKDLRTNLNVRFYSNREAIIGAARINSHFTLICGFLLIFTTMYNNTMLPTWILLPSVLSCILGYIFLYQGRNFNLSKFLEDSKTLLTVLLFGYLFAPLLHTLTGANSTDTIYFIAFLMMLINLISHDYGLNVTVLPRAVSITAAIFGAICLVSRLSTSYHAFVLLVVTVMFFIIYPMLTHMLWTFTCSCLLSCIVAYFILQFSTGAFYIFTAGVILLQFVCPLIFVQMQRYKQNIHGPWDEAILTLKTGMSMESH